VVEGEEVVDDGEEPSVGSFAAGMAIMAGEGGASGCRARREIVMPRKERRRVRCLSRQENGAWRAATSSRQRKVLSW
jgi:hypothetical protein